MSIITLNTRSLPDSAVTTAKIASDAVTDAKIADDVIGTEHLTAGEVDATALASNAVTTAKIADSAVTAAKTSGVTSDMFRNIIINGDMSVSQRSTSASSITSTGYHTIDRWNWQADFGTVTLSQDTDVPTGQGFATSFKADVTAAGTVSSDGTVILRQKIEGQNLQYLKKGTSSAESTTLSFWIKSTKTGTYICELYDVDNTRQISQSYTVSSSNTWEKKELTFAGDTSGAFGNDNANSLQINWYLSAGSDYTSGTLSTTWTSSTNANRAVGQVDAQDNTSNNIYLTGVQLETGTAASDFEFLPFDVNLRRCQRYYQKTYNLDTAPGTSTDTGVQWTSGSSDSAGNVSYLPNFMTSMRASPTVTGYARDGTSGEGYFNRSGTAGNGTFNSHMRGENSVSVYVALGGNNVVGTVAAHVTLDVEL